VEIQNMAKQDIRRAGAKDNKSINAAREDKNNLAPVESLPIVVR
jgi:hypothetical protein